MLHKIKFTVYFLLVTMVCVIGCDVTGEEGGEPPVEESSKEVLVALVGNAPSGFWFFDADSLTLIDSLHFDYTPSSLETDSENNIMFWVQKQENSTNKLFKYDVSSQAQTSVQTDGLKLTINKTGSYLISYGGSAKTQVFNTKDMSIISEDSLGYFRNVFSSQENNLFYGIKVVGEIGNYELHVLSVEIQNLNITEELIFEDLPSANIYDIDISIEEKYLFLTYTTRSDAEGRFVVFDLESNQMIGEFEIGPYPSMGLTADGNKVFVTSRESFYGTRSKNLKVFSYNLSDQRMEVFAEGPEEVGLSGGLISSENIIVGLDSQLLYLTPGNEDPKTGKKANLAQIDITNKTVLNSFQIPRDSDGRLTTLFGELKWLIKKN